MAMRRQRCSRGLPTPGLFSAMFHVEPSGRTDVPRGTLGTCSRIAQWALHSNRELAVIGETTPSPADPKDLKAQCGCSHSRVHLVRALHAHHRCAFPMRIPHAHSPPHAYSSCAFMMRIDYAYDPPRAGHHHLVWPHGRSRPGQRRCKSLQPGAQSDPGNASTVALGATEASTGSGLREASKTSLAGLLAWMWDWPGLGSAVPKRVAWRQQEMERSSRAGDSGRQSRAQWIARPDRWTVGGPRPGVGISPLEPHRHHHVARGEDTRRVNEAAAV